MSTNVGALKATLGLDATGFAAGIGKAKAEIKGLGATAQAAQKDMRSAAGANANLVSQFNDIGVMLAAGQSPLQLAMQQGTQISQVLAQMGGGVGALRAVGSAFVGMLNPVSLATIGVIGFGAAAVQWLMPAEDQAKKTVDAFESLKSSMSGYNDALSLSLLYTGASEEKYGAEAQKGAEIARRIMVMEANKTRSSVSAIISKAYSDLGFDAFGERGIDGAGGIESSNVAEAASQLGLDDKTWGDTLFGYGGVNRENLAMAESLGNTLRDIYSYVNQPIAEGGLDDYLTGLRERLDDYSEQLRALKDAGADEGALVAIDEKMVPLQQALLEGEAKRAQIRAADEAKAQEMLGTLEQQLYMHDLIAQHGQDSLAVRQAELDAEYAKQAAAIDSLNITEDQKDALYDALSGLHESQSETLAWADAMSMVRAEIGAIASSLAAMGGGAIANAGKFAELTALRQGRSVADAARARQRLEMETQFSAREAGAGTWAERMLIKGERAFVMRGMDLDAELDVARDTARANARKGGAAGGRRSSGGRRSGGRGAGGARRERANEFERATADIQSQTEAYQRQAEAIAQVTAAGGDWEHALAVIEEEQKLLNAAQKAGIPITEEMKAKVKDWAEANITAEETLERMRTATERGTDTARDFFGSILDGKDAAIQALEQLLAQIAKVQFAKGMLGLIGSTSWGSTIIKGIGALQSFDGGGDTGSGARAGGLDGKGGFLAMMHPNETVIDRTKGQSIGGGVIRVEIDKSDYFDARVTQIADQSSANMGKAVSASIKPTIQKYQVNPRKNR